ncbi:uncharacterized protein F5Z01DRAFT_673502 [Emericellopsis atlantica]|uniref:Uncharacterized protein n=1 Tax=Emericellopsis atlantica TaxID=2614577 RepID=A0A9P7ZMV0_9HYPO|nr:uncharacterized protein F5Z01DRAFT_673502 [Emericellopsis atlantica]KAG9254950.1 hypothetical protein F5Z01DRAFT_673502 [Emericellopsis atlantica]
MDMESTADTADRPAIRRRLDDVPRLMLPARPSARRFQDLLSAMKTEDVDKIPRLPHTPPASDFGSPHIKVEGSPTLTQRSFSSSYTTARSSPPASSPVQLPSLAEFDRGVESLIQSSGPPFPVRPLQRTPVVASEPLPPPRTLYDQPVYMNTQASQSHHYYHSPYPTSEYTSRHDASRYPSPSSEKGKHCNKKYTNEEGDFIIYMWTDKGLKWEDVCKEFRRRFGGPLRSTQGLQAWYYRANLNIPVWDDDGWLVFDNEDDITPQVRQIKCRERDALPTLCQRYPERAVTYHWVDPAHQEQASEWAAKRKQQLDDRQARRREREQLRQDRHPYVGHPNARSKL